MRKNFFKLCIALFGFVLLTGCGSSHKSDINTYSASVDQEAFSQEASALEQDLRPAPSLIIKPKASGILTATNDYATIDYSHTDEGYIMVLYTAFTEQRLKSQVSGPTTTYTYNLLPGEWTVFPLSDGNGDYQIRVFENLIDTRYVQVLFTEIAVTLTDEFAPFIRPNQYVNYENASATIDAASELCQGANDVLHKVNLIYDYVVTHISYDYDKAANVQSGYLPVLDEVLNSGKGICFDYAALMTGMLRSQGIPCKLVVGYAGDVYHAWINVWSPDTGWVDGAVYFNGSSWQRMDPTYASTSDKDDTAMEFIGNGANYTTKYIY